MPAYENKCVKFPLLYSYHSLLKIKLKNHLFLKHLNHFSVLKRAKFIFAFQNINIHHNVRVHITLKSVDFKYFFLRRLKTCTRTSRREAVLFRLSERQVRPEIRSSPSVWKHLEKIRVMPLLKKILVVIE